MDRNWLFLVCISSVLDKIRKYKTIIQPKYVCMCLWQRKRQNWSKRKKEEYGFVVFVVAFKEHYFCFHFGFENVLIALLLAKTKFFSLYFFFLIKKLIFFFISWNFFPLLFIHLVFSDLRFSFFFFNAKNMYKSKFVFNINVWNLFKKKEKKKLTRLEIVYNRHFWWCHLWNN